MTNMEGEGHVILLFNMLLFKLWDNFYWLNIHNFKRSILGMKIVQN